MSENKRVQARFLLGPAGSGKSFRCLAEIRAALLASAEGPPLIFLAPKQATFQLERQLLADASLAGYTRLRILSFERLAEFVLDQLSQPLPRLLDEEGRVMVLRALLAQRRDELQLFRASARLPGFAQQLSLLLRELQRFQIAPTQLERLAANASHSQALRKKLSDVALLLRAYREWLQQHALQDADGLLDVATAAMHAHTRGGHHAPQLGGLWLDGFAEMTPQESELLAALVPFCPQATLAFCLEDLPKENLSWLSTWSVVSQTFRRCFQKLSATPKVETVVEVLPRNSRTGRFAGSPALQHLEMFWTNPQPLDSAGRSSDEQLDFFPSLPNHAPGGVRIVNCIHAEAEAQFAAREILRFVRGGGRFREAAILLRQLAGYDEILRRVLNRFGIPFFLDRRESVAHHPLAELTRFALRTLAFGWQQEDWFGALKSGLVHADEVAIDRLENEAIARGWQGEIWLEPIHLPDEPDLEKAVEPLRHRLTSAFVRLASALGGDASERAPRPAGAQLAEALRVFWKELEIERTLTDWSAFVQRDELPSIESSTHLAVWRQMHSWLDNLALAFAAERLSLREWLPILESGLAGLTVGVIPPALDQVLIGTVDRSRNPDLKLALVVGMNDSVFPAAPGPATLLTEADRAALETENFFLGPSARHRLGHERYYGYIACTRPRERLVLTHAAQDADGHALNPSPFIAHLNRLFPDLKPETFSGEVEWQESQHASELLPAVVRQQIHSPVGEQASAWDELARLPAVARALPAARHQISLAESLAPGLVQLLYGATLPSSVSRLEEFAACPFKFFVSSGLRARERQQFELDVRERGSFQHEVLALFHERVRGEGKDWRDLTPTDARARIATIASALTPTFRDGLLLKDDRSRFTARSLSLALQDFIATDVGWMRQCEFNPRAVELEFGLKEAPLPAWTIELGGGRKLALRGKIDRVDLWMPPGSDEAWCVVIDYKSSEKKIDPVLLANGVQLQLPAYLKVVEQVAGMAEKFGVKRLIPAGVFYVNLRGHYASGSSRVEVLKDRATACAHAYQHTGRFNFEVLPQLDNRNVARGDQFNYRLTKDGALYQRSAEAMPPAAFADMLAGVENVLEEIGEDIFAGLARVDPYQREGRTPCEHCDYRPICRIDPWSHVYRTLRGSGATI